MRENPHAAFDVAGAGNDIDAMLEVGRLDIKEARGADAAPALLYDHL